MKYSKQNKLVVRCDGDSACNLIHGTQKLGRDNDKTQLVQKGLLCAEKYILPMKYFDCNT